MIAWTNLRLGIVGAWLAAAVVGLGMPVAAQQQADTDGRALDANLRVGSGGTNEQQEQTDYRARNDVVTGNVGGGRAFRGEVDYRAPGEFGGDLQSDDLFRFRRDAFGPSQPAGLPRGTFDVGSIYRPYTSPQAARPLIRPGQTETPWVLDDFRTLPGQTDLRLLDRPRPYDAFDRVPLDEMDGRWLEVSASPLLGVRSDVQPGAFGRPDVDAFNRRGELPRGPGFDEADELDDQDADEEEVDRTLRRSSMLDLRAYQLSAGIGTREEDRERSPGMAPTLMLGEQLRTQVPGLERGDRRTESEEQRMARLEERMFRPLQSVGSVEPGQDPYLDLLNAMHGQQQPGTAEEPLEQGDRVEDYAAGEEDEGAPRPDDPFDVPDFADGTGETEDDAFDGGRDAERDDADGDQRTRTERLLDRLDYDLPPLRTLAGEGEGGTARSMRRAEQLLREGEYFDAGKIYREVATLEADAPLARVGLVHAQLGAGMIRSAAANLRTLFEQHPELIAARYDAQLLPPEDRLDWLHGELRRMVESPLHAPADAALVLAYLGYQRGDEAMVDDALTALEEQEAHQGLTPVLRHVWTDQPETEAR